MQREGTTGYEKQFWNQEAMSNKTTSLHIAHTISVKHSLWDQGIEHQPGPTWTADDQSGMLLIESINITAMTSCANLIANRKAHIKFVQEHSIPVSGVQKWAKIFAAAQWQFDGGPLDPETNRTGGVGVLSCQPYTTVPYQAMGVHYPEAYKMGRIAAHWCEIGTCTVLMWNVYGWTGADGDEEVAQRSDDMMQIVHEETAQHPGVLALMVGDFNATSGTLPTLEHLEQTGQWIDVGAIASRWGGTDEQYTCKAN